MADTSAGDPDAYATAKTTFMANIKHEYGYEYDDDDEGPPPPPPWIDDDMDNINEPSVSIGPNAAQQPAVSPMHLRARAAQSPAAGASRAAGGGLVADGNLGGSTLQLSADRPISNASLRRQRVETAGAQRSDGTMVGAGGMTDVKLLQRLLQGPIQQHQTYGTTSVHAAAGSGDETVLSSLLASIPGDVERRSLLDALDQAGRTPLYFAVMAGSKGCVDLLLRAGADLHHVDLDGRTCGHWAAYLGRPRVLQTLLDAGFHCGVPDKEGRTAMHWAAGTEDSKCLQLLLKDRTMAAGVVNTSDLESMTALHWAAFHHRAKQLSLLIKAGTDLTAADIDGRPALHWAAVGQDVACAKLLLAANVALVNATDHKGRTALHVAASEGSPALCTLLLKTPHCNNDAQDADGRTALHWACALDRQEVVAVLVKRGCRDDLADKVAAAPLHYCAQYDKPRCVVALLKRKRPTDPLDEHGRTALMWAVSHGHIEVTRSLLAVGSGIINPNVQDSDGRTALHLAAYAGFIAGVVELLQAREIQVDLADNAGQSPLFTAVDQNQLEVVELLLQRGCRPDLADLEGKTPLHWASIAGNEALAQALLGRPGFDVNVYDLRGETPLHYACFFGQGPVAQLLVETAGAEINVQDLEGICPLHWAVLRGHEDIVAFLLQAGAYPNYMEHNGSKSTPLDYAVAAVVDEALSQRLQEQLIAHGAVGYESMRYLAAIVLQSARRGQLVRQNVKQLKRQHQAAIIVQAAVRGHQQRRRYHALRSQSFAASATTAATTEHKTAVDDAEGSKGQQLQHATAKKSKAERQRQQQEEEALRCVESKAKAEEARRLLDSKRRGEEARRRVLEEKKAKQEQEEKVLEARRRQLTTQRQAPSPANKGAAEANALDHPDEEGMAVDLEDAAALQARLDVLEQQRSRSNMIHQEQRRKRDVRGAVQAAIRIQRAWRRYCFRLAHPELVTHRRVLPTTHGKAARYAGALANSHSKKPHHVPSLLNKKTSPRRLQPRRMAVTTSFAHEMNRPDFMQRTIAALTIQLWWRRLLARHLRSRRQDIRMLDHEAPAFLVQMQRTRVRNIYGPSSSNVYQYCPPISQRGRQWTHGRLGQRYTGNLPPVRAVRQRPGPIEQTQQRLAADKMRPKHVAAPPSISRFPCIPAIHHELPLFHRPAWQ